MVNYRVYDHTYHEGITLDERDEVVQEAAKETAWRQGQSAHPRNTHGDCF